MSCISIGAKSLEPDFICYLVRLVKQQKHKSLEPGQWDEATL